MTDKQFIQHVRDEAAAISISVTLTHSTYVNIGELKCGGYCSDTELKVAIGKPRRVWFPILVHEFCHLQQTARKSHASELADIPFYDRLCAVDILQQWIEGTDFPASVVNKSQRRSRNMELDCEKRVLRVAQKLDLDMDLDMHIRQSNAYIFFYEVARRHRVWMKPGKLYCTNKPLMEAAPTKFLPVSQYSHVEDHPELYRQLILASERVF